MPHSKFWNDVKDCLLIHGYSLKDATNAIDTYQGEIAKLKIGDMIFSVPIKHICQNIMDFSK